MSNIRWQMYKTEALPDILFGYGLSGLPGSPYIHRVMLDEKMVAVGFSNDNEEFSYNPPSIVVISKDYIPETLSWLKVYAPQTSPLSQLARVISIEDWDTFQYAGLRRNSSSLRTDCWGSIILGEILSQGDTDTELNAIPLSRSHACFSTALARAAVIHGNNDATLTCIERLKVLASDKRFVRRPVSVDELLPIWQIMSAQIKVDSLDLILDIVIETSKKYTLEYLAFNNSLPTLLQYPMLQSDSIEERTVEFKKVASDVMLNFADKPYSIYTSALLASAAFLVGRGTSHSFMLRPISRRLPSVFAWFGLIAALAGPKSWDTDWSKATKGIERLLRAKFDWGEPSLSDLSWEEYAWLSRTFDAPDVFNDLPKMLPKVLSVEIIPGTLCQFRLSSEKGPNKNEAELQKNSIQDPHSVAIQSALLQISNIIQKTLALIDTTNVPSQQTLGFVGTEQAQTTESQSKRTKRNKN